MIQLKMNGDEPEVIQTAEPPLVYLDHWALRAISEDPSLIERFVQSLKSKRGTLAISFRNIMEFRKVSWQSSQVMADVLAQEVFPNLFFIEVDPFVVIQKEDEPGAENCLASIIGQLDLLQYAVDCGSESINPLSLNNFFSNIWPHREELGDQSELQIFVAKITEFRQRYLEDPNFKKLVDAPTPGPHIPRATRSLVRDLLSITTRDQFKKFTFNDVEDFEHTIVPSSYCHILLLDGHWKTQALNSISRLEGKGRPFFSPLIFSKKDDGINRAIDAIENWEMEPKGQAK